MQSKLCDDSTHERLMDAIRHNEYEAINIIRRDVPPASGGCSGAGMDDIVLGKGGDKPLETELRGGGTGTLAPFEGKATWLFMGEWLGLGVTASDISVLFGRGRGGAFVNEGEGGRAGKGLYIHNYSIIRHL